MRVIPLAVALTLIATFVSGPASSAPQLIRVGFAQVSEEPLWLMDTPGGVKPNEGKDYQLEMTTFRSSADRMKAYEAGALDCETGSPLNLIFAAASGLMDFSSVATISQQDPHGVVTSYLVRDDIKKPSDLKGKIIAVNAYKSLTDLLERTALIKAGLNPDRDVKFVLMGYPEGPDALRAHLVDMVQVDEPAKTEELRKGGVHLLFSFPDIIGGTQDQNTLFCRKDFLKAHGPAVRAFLADYILTLKAYLKDRRRAYDYLAKAQLTIAIPPDQPVPPDYSRPIDGKVSVRSFHQIQDAMLKAGFITTPVNVDDLVDNSYLPRGH
jgi:ABC-type nitrate/sulfonate/bicarbonate transport system substrate-binding protein